MNKVKRLLMTILTSGIATILSFLISFILTPYITNKLGVEAYGFVTLAKNFTQYATIITIALTRMQLGILRFHIIIMIWKRLKNIFLLYIMEIWQFQQ